MASSSLSHAVQAETIVAMGFIDAKCITGFALHIHVQHVTRCATVVKKEPITTQPPFV